MDCENKGGDNFIAKDSETLTAFLCASLDSMCTNSGLGIAFMNDNTCYIAIQAIGKIGKMNTVEFIKSLNDFIKSSLAVLNFFIFGADDSSFISAGGRYILKSSQSPTGNGFNALFIKNYLSRNKKQAVVFGCKKYINKRLFACFDIK